MENTVGQTLHFSYSKLSPRGGYMLVGLFCLVTKGQKVAVSYKKTRPGSVWGCRVQREAFSFQPHSSKDGVLTPRRAGSPRATPDRHHTPRSRAGRRKHLEAPRWPQPPDSPWLHFPSTSRPSSRAQQGHPLPTSTQNSHTIHQPSASPSEGPTW